MLNESLMTVLESVQSNIHLETENKKGYDAAIFFAHYDRVPCGDCGGICDAQHIFNK